MSDRSADLLFDDIKESIGKIDRYIRGMSAADFIKDEKTIDAVAKNLEIIGEAANRLPEDFTNQHPNIEWRKINGLRHRIVHEYFGVDLDLVQKLKEDLSQIHP